MKLSQDKIEKIRTYLKDKPVLKAYLFGSFLRGDAIESSDIDLLVELDYSQRVGLAFIKMKLDLEEILGKEVDLISSKGLSRHLQPIIDKEKELIYAR